ncbi:MULTISPECIES: ankyrin repeat domain-containing protein [Candidatus Cardinium]|uniref:ankyrin repeat domain-containing protein n=1 Tax=Candidatus Cardinium TaxID=273135 RepID=UPI001FAA7E48|nr:MULTISPECIES: ankyrin repeat domain-containing protein [Cardinium]
MKKHTYYKVGLFTGLLACNTLTACVNTKQKLGFNPFNSARNSSNNGYYQNNSSKQNNSRKTMTQQVGRAVSLACALTGIVVVGRYLTSYVTNQSNALISGNETILIQSLMPADRNSTTIMPHRIDELTTSAYNALESGRQKWGNANDTIIDELTTSVNNTIEHSKKNCTHILAVPYTINDPMVLDDQILRIIKQAHCDLEPIKCLIKRGLSPNAKHSNGATLVMCAAVHNNQETLKFLIDNGADVKAAQTAANDLEEGNPGPIDLAILLGHKNIVELLISSRAAVEEVDRKGLLMAAAKLGYTDIFNLLLEKGANPCIKLTDEPLNVQGHIKAIINNTAAAEFIAESPKVKQWCVFPKLTKDKNNNDIQNMTNALNKAIEKWHPQKKKCPGV